MSPPLLSICIPTRNRCGYLRELLERLEAEARGLNLPAGRIEIRVSDNASTDGTAELVRAMSARWPVLEHCPNEVNIGAERNVIRCFDLARGEFCWISGDDDRVHPGALGRILDALNDAGLGLMVNLDTNYEARIERPRRFGSFRDYARGCAQANPHILIEHTLLTSNVFRTARFDRAAAEAAIHTNYPHMYGLAQGLRDRGGAVLLTAFPAIEVRARRAPAVDGAWPENLERSWVEYLGWIRRECDVPELSPERAVGHVREALFHKLRRHPLRFIWNNLPALVQPQAYAYFFKRLWHNRRRPPA
jgi:glycosyltransferase involved in cell wall biosynthesis